VVNLWASQLQSSLLTLEQAPVELVIAQQARTMCQLLEHDNDCTATRSCSYLVQENHVSLFLYRGQLDKMDQANHELPERPYVTRGG